MEDGSKSLLMFVIIRKGITILSVQPQFRKWNLHVGSKQVAGEVDITSKTSLQGTDIHLDGLLLRIFFRIMR